MRAVGDPDVYLGTDLGVRQAVARLTRLAGTGLDPAATVLDPAATAPWRSYLTHHLWAGLADPAPSTGSAPATAPTLNSLSDKDIR